MGWLLEFDGGNVEGHCIRVYKTRSSPIISMPRKNTCPLLAIPSPPPSPLRSASVFGSLVHSLPPTVPVFKYSSNICAGRSRFRAKRGSRDVSKTGDRHVGRIGVVGGGSLQKETSLVR